jgi:hypothetical protein
MTDTPSDRPQPETDLAKTGPPAHLIAIAAVAVGLIGFIAAYAIASVTSGDEDSDAKPQASDEFLAGSGPASLPVLEPTAVGGYSRPDVPAGESAVETGELSDTPPEDAVATFPVESGQPSTPDIIVVDAQAPPDAGQVPLQLVPPAPPPPPAVILPGLEPAVSALEVPTEDDIDGSPPLESEPAAAAATDDSLPGTTVAETTETSDTTSTEPTDSTDTDGGVPVDEPPVEAPGIIDPCAAEEPPAEEPPSEEDPPADCGPGLGGTIIPLGHLGLGVIDVTATPGDRCESQVDSVPRDRMLVTLISTARGEFDVFYRPEDTDDGWWGVTVTSAVNEESFAEAHENVQTCFLIDRVDGVTHYEVAVEGRAIDDGTPGLPWSGRLALPVADGRPPVTITPVGSRKVEVYVPAAEAESVEVWTIPRTSDVTGSRCGELDDLRSGDDPGSFGIRLHHETNRISLPGMGTWDPAINSLRQHDVYFYDEDATDLCVIWYRELEPSREVVERQSWLLLPPAHPDAQFTATGFVDAAGRGDRLHGGDYDGVIANISNASGNGLCSAGVTRDEITADGEKVFCHFEVTPDRSTVVFEMGPIGAPGPASPAAYRAAIELRSDPCAAVDLDECTEVYAVGVPGPEVGGERAIMGTFQFEVRYGETPIRSREWVTAPTGTFATPEGELPDHPQLDIGATSIEMDPNDPFRVLLHWQADRTVEVAHASGTSVSGIPCRSNGSPNAPAVTPDIDFEGDRGTIPLNVCPGTPYVFTLTLVEDGVRYRFTPSPRGDDGPNPEFHWAEGVFRTDKVEIRIDIDLKTRSASGVPGGFTDETLALPLESQQIRRPVGEGSAFGNWDIRYLRVQVGSQNIRPEERTGNYECGTASYHDTSLDDPFIVTTGPEVGFQLEVQMWRFSACGLFGNVPITAGGAWADWSTGIFRGVPILDLLEAEDGWRLQDFHWTWPDQFAACRGVDNFEVHDYPDGRSAHEGAEEFRRAMEGDELDDPEEGALPREVGGIVVEAGSCNPRPGFDVNMDIRAEMAGPASVVDTVEVAGG